MASVAHYVEEFLCNLDASRATVKTYTTGLRVFLSYRIPLDVEVFDHFHSRLLNDARKLKYTTRATYFAALRKFVTWMDIHDRLPRGFNTSRALARVTASVSARRKPYQPRLPDPLLPSLLEYYRPVKGDTSQDRVLALRNNAIIHVLFSTGARVSEVAGLTRKQVGHGSAAECVVMGKGGRSRTIFMDAPARAAIRAYLDAREDHHPALFVRHNNVPPVAHLTSAAMDIIVHEAAYALRLKPGTTCHSIRHYVATDMLHRGVPLEVVQMFLGHVSIDTTRTVYAHTPTSDLRDHVARYQRRKTR